EVPEPQQPTPQGPAAVRRSGAPGALCRWSALESPVYRTRIDDGIFHCRPQLFQTPRDAAGDRPGRQLQRLADRAVALVAGEEAVEDLLAAFRQRRHRLPHRERLVELGDPIVDSGRLDVLAYRFPGSAKAVDARSPCELRDPRPNGAVVAETV